MKQLIKDILEDVATGQPNLESEAAREMVSNLIMAGIKSNGWFLDLGEKLDTAGYPIKKISKYLTTNIDEVQMIDSCSHGNDLLSNCLECDEQQARESWVCGICGESTYDVEYDYVGSGTNHLNCELEIEMKNPDD